MTDPPVPPVSLFRLFSRMGGWIVLVIGVFLLFFTWISHLSLEEAKRFETDGQMAEATVLKKYTTTSRETDGGEETDYWLEFTFITQAKDQIVKKETVNTSLYKEVDVGGTFDLFYLPSEPSEVETSPGSNRMLSRLTQGFALVFGLVWLAGFWRVGRWAVDGARARRYGTRHRVKVTSIDRTNVRINNRPRYRLTWVGPNGDPGRSLLQRGSWVEDIKPGDTVDIYQGVKTGWWVGDVGEREE